LTPGLRRFFASESAGGLTLAAAAALALLLSNSPWADDYEALRAYPGGIHLGALGLSLSLPLLAWVNELWMAVFFFLVGLEIKRELVAGELSSFQQMILPMFAALGGMLVPAFIYWSANGHDAAARQGWAIPSATDIAFALGIVLLLGSRVPSSLKVFLTAVAIMDDLGAIAVIALFYTRQLHAGMLMAAGVCVLLLLALNRARVVRSDVYIVLGLVLWCLVLKSGVHPTLAGLVTALFIPMHDGKGGSPAETLEHALHPWVSFCILPVFAFVNAGVALGSVGGADLLHPVVLGIAMGLLSGKTAGVFGCSWLLIRLGLCDRPGKASWIQLLGVCVLCGIGFTMSLFIGGLAFEGLGPEMEVRLKLGVLGGSLLAGVFGALILSWGAGARRMRRTQA